MVESLSTVLGSGSVPFYFFSTLLGAPKRLVTKMYVSVALLVPQYFLNLILEIKM